MKVFLVEYLTNKEVGNICGEDARDTYLAHIAYCEEDALSWAIDNSDWDKQDPAWHWCITPREVGDDGTFSVLGEHFTCDGYPCRCDGTIDEKDVTPDDKEYSVHLLLPAGTYDLNIDESEKNEKAKQDNKEYACKNCTCKPETDVSSFKKIALEDIEDAYEVYAHDKFAGIANKLANKLDDMCDVVLDLADNLRQEFPEEE